MPKKSEYIKFKNCERKIKSPFIIYVDFKVFQCQKIMESKIQKSLIQTNIKNILLVIMAVNQYMLMISLVSLLKHTYEKIKFTIPLMI